MDNFLERASKLAPGDKVEDCNYKIVTIYSIEPEYNLTKFGCILIDIVYFLRLYSLQDYLYTKFGSGRIPFTTEVTDYTIIDTDGRCHQFMTCCDFVEKQEHAMESI